jgi:small-conductance mechanosensitive channel
MGGNEMSEPITEDLLCLPAGESMDKTPETNGAEWHAKTPGYSLGADVAYASVARQLETELNATKAENERLKTERQQNRFRIDQLTAQNERMTRDRDELRKKIESGVSAYEASLVEATQLRAKLAEAEKGIL